MESWINILREKNKGTKVRLKGQHHALRYNQTQYFLKSQSEEIADMLSRLGQKELLMDLKELDPDRRDQYQSYLMKISE